MIPAPAGAVRASRLLAGLPQAAQDEVLSRAHERRLARGGTLFREGDLARVLYLVELGWLKLTQLSPDGREVVGRFLGPGEILGAVVALDGGPYPGTAQAITPARLYAWRREPVPELAERYPQLRANIMDTVSRHLRESMEQVRLLTAECVGQRLARMLLRLTEQGAGAGGLSTELPAPLGRQELAEMIGATIYTVSRLLSQWEQAGILATGRQQITILDPARLTALAREG